MKIPIGVLIAILIIECDCRQSPRNDIPTFFFRRLKELNEEKRCEKIKIKSQSANITLTQMDEKLAYDIRIKMASGVQFEKIVLLLEITGISSRTIKKFFNRKYIAIMQPIEDSLDRRTFAILPTYAEKKFLEFRLDFTSMARNKSMPDSPTEMNFIFTIQHSNGKALRSLIRSDTKAFAIMYQNITSCNLMDTLGHGIDFQKSPDLIRGLGRKNLKSVTNVIPGEICEVTRWTVKLADIGVKGIIAPAELNIGVCTGLCSPRNYKTGYAFLQNAYNEVFNKGQSSSCRPSKFGGTSMIYVDPADGTFVMTQFSNMVVTKCDCF